MLICLISKVGSSAFTGPNVNNKQFNKPARINRIWIKDDDFILLYSSSLAFSSDNKFAGQRRKHNSPSYKKKTMIINPLPSNRGFHSNCAALSLKCCRRSMMIHPVESMFVLFFNGCWNQKFDFSLIFVIRLTKTLVAWILNKTKAKEKHNA